MKLRLQTKRSSEAVPAAEFLPFNRSILDRLENITWELQSVHVQIQSQADQFAALANRRPSSETAADLRVLARFKSALDQLRQSLWLKLIDLPMPPQSAHEGDRSARLKRAVEELSRELSPRTVNAEPEPGSFFERLEVVIDSCMNAQQKAPEAKPLRTRRA